LLWLDSLVLMKGMFCWKLTVSASPALGRRSPSDITSRHDPDICFPDFQCGLFMKLFSTISFEQCPVIRFKEMTVGKIHCFGRVES
jgi:hypothetical protein